MTTRLLTLLRAFRIQRNPRKRIEKILLTVVTRQGGISLRLSSAILKTAQLAREAKHFPMDVDVEAAYMLVWLAAVQQNADRPVFKLFSERMAYSSPRFALLGLPMVLRTERGGLSEQTEWIEIISSRYTRMRGLMANKVLANSQDGVYKVTQEFSVTLAESLCETLDLHLSEVRQAIASVIEREFNWFFRQRSTRSRLTILKELRLLDENSA